MPVYRNYQILWASMHIMASISSEQTDSYTVISDTVNLVARLEDANRTYVPLVLISEPTKRLAALSVETLEIDPVLVVGESEPQRISSCSAAKGEVERK
jgi:adenylate cyclase